jgi:alkylation response protein AidB-like acyl-CoA dehydrogenase
MQAGVYAMEACTYQTAALIDSGAGDFMLETAMLKVFSTEVLWKILNDTFQLYGGKAYFTDEPFERMVRDARINTIGEGANDVLRAFSALVGLRDVGLELEKVLHSFFTPLQGFGNLGRFAGRKLGALFVSPQVPVSRIELEGEATSLGKLISELGRHGEKLLVLYQKEIVEKQYQLARIADAATEIYVSACVLRRVDAELKRAHHPHEVDLNLATARYYLAAARRRIRHSFAALWDNDDEATTELADRMLHSRPEQAEH